MIAAEPLLEPVDTAVVSPLAALPAPDPVPPLTVGVEPVPPCVPAPFTPAAVPVDEPLAG